MSLAKELGSIYPSTHVRPPMSTNRWTNTGGKKPTAPGTENIPPTLVTDLPTTPKTPTFPKKRPRSTSHTGGDCSPSKRQDLGISKSTTSKVLPNERSPLFGDATNSCPKNIENNGEVPIAKLKTTVIGRVKKGGSKKRMKMAVMIPVKNRHPAQRELGTDVQVDIFN